MQQSDGTTLNALDLMEIRANTLFTANSRGRILRINEQGGDPAPRLFLGQTRDGFVMRAGDSLPDTLAQRLSHLARDSSPTGDGRIAPSLVQAIREILSRHAPVTAEGGGPAYLFTALTSPSGDAIRITADNAAMLDWLSPAFAGRLAERQPCFAIVKDRVAVSACFSSRVAADAAEAGVETVPTHRGRGYATVVTSAWAAAVRESGRIPFYSTSWNNMASQAVARHLGLSRLGADASWW